MFPLFSVMYEIIHVRLLFYLILPSFISLDMQKYVIMSPVYIML
jgi:hypothetical protein